ncbi:protein CHROMATIN REMODELING 20-like [Salvia divinorum]|uniref:Protein CHROMATIN REMODELING 20-like n=1 Tax=Salvia divinorum TaxID=28513 RepID=A0ABD1FGY6_SALDI
MALTYNSNCIKRRQLGRTSSSPPTPTSPPATLTPPCRESPNTTIIEKDDVKDDLKLRRKETLRKKSSRKGEHSSIDEESSMDVFMFHDDGSTKDAAEYLSYHNLPYSFLSLFFFSLGF